MSLYFEEDLQSLSQCLNDYSFGGRSFLITGCTGLIGRVCVKAIAKYNEMYENKITVYVLVRNKNRLNDVFTHELEDHRIELLIHDINQPLPDDFRVDYIIHTASPTNSKFIVSYPVETLDTIYTGTYNVLRYARRKGIEGMVYLSSMEAFGQVDTSERIQEEQLGYISLQSIRSSYSEGKRAAELLCKCYSDEYGVPVRIARLAQVFGAGVPKEENRVFAQFARSAKKGNDIILHTTGESVGNYCYTEDAIRAILLLLKNGDKGGVYTVANEETSCTIAEMASMVAETFSEGKSKVVFDIAQNNEFGYAPSTKIRLSSEKLRRLGWKPKYSLRQMYERMLPDIAEE